MEKHFTPQNAERQRTIDALRSINVQGDQMLRLERLIIAGYSAQELIESCNEWGQCVFDGPSDPGTLRSRKICTDGVRKTAARNRETYDPDFHHPSLRKIETLKRLTAESLEKAVQLSSLRGNGTGEQQEQYLRKVYPDLFRFQSAEEGAVGELMKSERMALEKMFGKEQGQEKPPEIRKLETLEEWMAYFDQFDTPENITNGNRPVLRTILENLVFMEITDGCDAPCRSVCAVSVATKVQGHIPFEVLSFLIPYLPGKYTRNDISFYYASDPKYYDVTGKDGQRKTAVDILELYRKITEKKSYISTSFGLDEKSIEFLYLMLIKGFPIDRISRLVTGDRPDDFERMMKKLEIKAEKTGIALPAEAQSILKRAYDVGQKVNGQEILGNAIHPETAEQDISTAQIACQNGIILTKNGFDVVMLMPPSKCFPDQQLKFPLAKEQDGTLKIPRRRYLADLVNPSTGFIFISQPEWIIVSPDGAKTDLTPKKIQKRNNLYEDIKHAQDFMRFLQTEKDLLTKQESWDSCGKLIDKNLFTIRDGLFIVARIMDGSESSPGVRRGIPRYLDEMQKIIDNHESVFRKWEDPFLRGDFKVYFGPHPTLIRCELEKVKMQMSDLQDSLRQVQNLR